ncbi:MAG: hypothetical protein K2X37_06385 [Chitinophagaceae bacterium]|nr:hypothetical protein [Chitinophagaceae bacterium]
MRALFFLFILISSLSYSQATKETATYTKQGLYKIQFPNNWRLDTSRILGTDVILFSPLENDSDKFSENINLLIQTPTTSQLTLEDYKEISEKQIEALVSKSDIFESEIKKSTRGNYYRSSYKLIQGERKLKSVSLAFLKQGKIFLLTFTAEESKYDAYIKVAQEILDSFTLE